MVYLSATATGVLLSTWISKNGVYANDYLNVHIYRNLLNYPDDFSDPLYNMGEY